MYRNMPPKDAVKSSAKPPKLPKPSKVIELKGKTNVKAKKSSLVADAERSPNACIRIVEDYFKKCGIIKKYYKNGPRITVYLFFVREGKEICFYYLTYTITTLDNIDAFTGRTGSVPYKIQQAFDRSKLAIHILTLQSVFNGLGTTFAVMTYLFGKCCNHRIYFAELDDAMDSRSLPGSIYEKMEMTSSTENPVEIIFTGLDELDTYTEYMSRRIKQVEEQHRISAETGLAQKVASQSQSQSEYNTQNMQEEEDVLSVYESDDESDDASDEGLEDALPTAVDTRHGFLPKCLFHTRRWIEYYLDRKLQAFGVKEYTRSTLFAEVRANIDKTAGRGWVFPKGVPGEGETVIDEAYAFELIADDETSHAMVEDSDDDTSYSMVEDSQGSLGGKSKKSIKKKSNTKKLHYTKKPKQRKSKKTLRIFTMKKRKTK